MSNGNDGPPFRVTNLSFRALLQRLGIIPYPQLGFTFDTTIVPVSIVDSDISLNALSVPPTLNLPFTAGELVNPAANTRLADTGPLPFGDYNVTLIYSVNQNQSIRFKRRNAADAADVWSSLQNIINLVTFVYTTRIHLELNERLVVENPAAVVGTIQASIWAAV